MTLLYSIYYIKRTQRTLHLLGDNFCYYSNSAYRPQPPSTGLHLLSTTAVFSYAIGSRKLSANEQFFVGAQTVVSLLQTTETKHGVSFIAANKVYSSTNKTTIV